MTHLSLDGNSVSDVSPLSGLVSLMILRLQGNSVTDLSPLVANPGLADTQDGVWLRNNPLDCEEQAENIQALEDRGVSVSTSC